MKRILIKVSDDGKNVSLDVDGFASWYELRGFLGDAIGQFFQPLRCNMTCNGNWKYLNEVPMFSPPKPEL